MRARANGFQNCSSGVITGVKQSARFRYYFLSVSIVLLPYCGGRPSTLICCST